MVAALELAMLMVSVDVPPTGMLVGLKVLVPWGAALKFAVIVVAFPPPVGVTKLQGFAVGVVKHVVPVSPAVPVIVQELNANPEFTVAVIVTVVFPAMLLEVHVPGQLMPPVLLVTVPPPAGEMTAVRVSASVNVVRAVEPFSPLAVAKNLTCRSEIRTR